MITADKYVEAYSCEIGGWADTADLGIKILVSLGREIDDSDKRAIRKLVDPLIEDLQKETLRLRPKTAEEATLERAEIVNLFAGPIFVEEIPNGYCSRYCCAFKPWFVVTTGKGRIKIGWRKSVIHLEWTDSAIGKTAAEVFPKEEAWPGYETTQYDKVIHAHGYQKAAEYIQRLMQAI